MYANPKVIFVAQCEHIEEYYGKCVDATNAYLRGK